MRMSELSSETRRVMERDNNKRYLCIYHGDCDDGFTSAYGVYKALGDKVEFHPGFHGVYDYPDPTGKDVIIVDFSYDRKAIEDIKKKSRSFILLDHHISAKEKLCDIDGCHFDMNESGASLAWKHFHKCDEKNLPEFIKTVRAIDLGQDHDDETGNLHRLKLLNRSYDYSFSNWDKLFEKYEKDYDGILKEGEIIEQFYNTNIDKMEKMSEVVKTFGFPDGKKYKNIPVVNAPRIFCSDLATKLCQGQPFGVVYYDDLPKGKRCFSLRSDENGLDVSKVAEEFGGGGHKRAGGFAIDIGDDFKME